MAGFDFTGNFFFSKYCFFIAGDRSAGNDALLFGTKHWNCRLFVDLCWNQEKKEEKQRHGSNENQRFVKEKRSPFWDSNFLYENKKDRTDTCSVFDFAGITVFPLLPSIHG